jgi:hypothetical protein
MRSAADLDGFLQNFRMYVEIPKVAMNKVSQHKICHRHRLCPYLTTFPLGTHSCRPWESIPITAHLPNVFPFSSSVTANTPSSTCEPCGLPYSAPTSAPFSMLSRSFHVVSGRSHGTREVEGDVIDVCRGRRRRDVVVRVWLYGDDAGFAVIDVT